MLQDQKETQTAEGMVDGSEPYRRLIELQKQMIELVRHHEKTRRECTTLRAQLMEEMASQRRSRWSLWPRISRPAAERLKKFVASWKSRLENHREPNGCFLPGNRPDCRKALDCASPLALLALRWNRKRQRAAAVQNAIAPAPIALNSRPPCAIRESPKLLPNRLLKI